MEDILPNLREDNIYQKDAWICFVSKKIEEKYKEVDIRVYCRGEDETFCEKIFRKIPNGYIPSDTGNTLNGWENWSLADILFKFGFQYNLDIDVRIRALKELSKIVELKSAIEDYLELMGIIKTYD